MKSPVTTQNKSLADFFPISLPIYMSYCPDPPLSKTLEKANAVLKAFPEGIKVFKCRLRYHANGEANSS